MNAEDRNKLLADFVEACKEDNQEIHLNAQICGGSGASRKFLNLDTEEEVIRFIGNGGLEKPLFQKTEPFRNAPQKEKPCLAYSYLFESGSVKGYISIAYLAKRKVWRLKSFKEHDQKKHIKAKKGPKKLL